MYSGMPLERKEEIQNGTAVKYLPIVNFADFAGDFGNIRHEGGVALNSGKKPEKLLKMLLEYVTLEGDLVLDFFGGEDVIIVTRGKNAVFNRVLKLPQSHKTTNWCAA